jgi:membrane protease YdiL (CAAX protease family)
MDPLVSEAADAQAPADQVSPAIWGPVATVLWTVLIAVVALVVQLCTVFAYMLITVGYPGDQTAAVIGQLAINRAVRSICTFATLLVLVPLVIGIVKLKRGSKVDDYLGLKWPPLKEALRWSIIALCYCLLFEAITLLWEPPVSEITVKTYATGSRGWLFWLALTIATPIHEEICFRGFLFKGLAASRLRWSGATLITAALWAAAHLQHNWFWMLYVFGGGLILGIVRAKTNSTLLTIWLHIIVNGLAAAKTVFVQLQE